MTKPATKPPTDAAPPSPEETQRRLGLLNHAIASASLEGVQIDDKTKDWVEDFAHGRLTEEEVIRRIKADV